MLHARKLARHEAPTGHLMTVAGSRPLAAHPREIPSHHTQRLQRPHATVLVSGLKQTLPGCRFQAGSLQPPPPAESAHLVSVAPGLPVPPLPLLQLLLPPPLLPLPLLVPHSCLHFVVDCQAAVCKELVEEALVAVGVLGLQEMLVNQYLEVAEVADPGYLAACLSLSIAVVVVVVAVKVVPDTQVSQPTFERVVRAARAVRAEQVVRASQHQQSPSKHPNHPPLVAETHED